MVFCLTLVARVFVRQMTRRRVAASRDPENAVYIHDNPIIAHRAGDNEVAAPAVAALEEEEEEEEEEEAGPSRSD